MRSSRGEAACTGGARPSRGAVSGSCPAGGREGWRGSCAGSVRPAPRTQPVCRRATREQQFYYVVYTMNTTSAVGRYLRGRSSAVKFSIVLSSFRVRIVRSRRAGGKTWCTRCPGTVQPWAHDGAPQRDVWGAARRFSCGSGVQSAPGNRGDGVCGLLWRSSRSPRRRPAAPG